MCNESAGTRKPVLNNPYDGSVCKSCVNREDNLTGIESLTMKNDGNSFRMR